MDKAESTSVADYLVLVGALVPPSALDLLGQYLDERVINTPYGEVGPLALRGRSHGGHGGARCWIQPYTGLPTRTDPRATLYAARLLGLSSVLSWDMGIALNPALALGQTVLACDYIDRTRHQPPTFRIYEDGDALPSELVNQIQSAAQKPIQLFDPRVAEFFQMQVPPHQHNAAPQSMVPALYLGLDGPRRETPAEARLYRQWGADVLGHNLIPEVFLAHELGLNYSGIVTIRARSADLAATTPSRAAPNAVPLGIEQTLQQLAELILVGA